MKARMAREAIVRVRNRIGALGQVTNCLAEKGVNIEAVIATLEGGDAVIRLVTDDHLRTVDALRALRPDVQEARIVMAEVAHRPGLLGQITGKLASESIDLFYLYGTATDGDKCLVIFSSTNNERAVMVLNG